MSVLLKNRYQILQVLSEAGGFGQTFLAEDADTPSRRKCVIKKLRPVADAEDFKFVQERFQREAAILERLGDSCDQIPKLYAYFVENQEFYLVQELIDGLTLKQKLQREGALDENTVRDLLRSLLNVLEYVHAQNIIHRDIKPDNIILRQRDNNPVLIDFGIVKEVLRVGVDGSPTSSVMAGTPGYTASEQAAGRPIYASDLYSLGATAIYLLTGKNPQQMTELATGDIAWQQFAPQIGSNFSAILNKATESHARDRYKTVSEMREDLQRVLRGEPTDFARPLSATTEEKTVVKPDISQPFVKQPQESNYALYTGGAVVALIAVIVATVLFLNLNNSSRETAQAADAQNINANRSTNSTTIQNTNLSNANSTTANSNAQTDSNVALSNPNTANANTNANITPTPSPTPININGTWIVSYSFKDPTNPNYKGQSKFKFKRSGETLFVESQNLNGDFYPEPNGKIVGDKITIILEEKGERVTYFGTVTGNTMRGSIKAYFPGTWSARKF